MRQLGLVGLLDQEAVQAVQNETTTKMGLLLDHFGIDRASETCWAQLALALAKKHVPGFQPPPKPQGRPKERSYDVNTLVLLVKLLTLRDGLSVRAAIRKISATGSVTGSEERLRDLYRRAANRSYSTEASMLGVIIDGFARDHGSSIVVQTLEEIVEHLLLPK